MIYPEKEKLEFEWEEKGIINLEFNKVNIHKVIYIE